MRIANAMVAGLSALLLHGNAVATNILATPVPWRIEVLDIHGVPVEARRLRDHVTLVIFSTRETQERSIRLGQEAGSRFGERPGYLSLTVANTSQLSFLLRPLAAGRVAAVEREAIETALARQHARGNSTATEEDVRKRVVFVHDADGHVWRSFGIDPASRALHVGVIDAAARLVHLARDPIDEAELFTVLGAELAKLEPGR
jgi:hypothetical protein